MASIEEISKLLDEKLKPLQNDIGDLKTDVGALKTDVGALKTDVGALKTDVGALKTNYGTLQRTVGALVETNMRKEAESMFGVTFAKRFLIRSLHDAVHLLTKAKYAKLTPDAVDERAAAANKLAEKAKKFAVPAVTAFCKSFFKRYKDVVGPTTVSVVEDALTRNEYGKALGILVGTLDTLEGSADDVAYYIKRLKKAFSRDSGVIDFRELLTCDGPGVMLLELASKYEVSELEEDCDIFQKGKLHEQIENDLRGTISLVEHHATITCGEVKSSFSGLVKAKSQLLVRSTFLKMAIETIFPDQFTVFLLIGHVFVPIGALGDRTQVPGNEVEGSQISIYIHTV